MLRKLLFTSAFVLLASIATLAQPSSVKFSDNKKSVDVKEVLDVGVYGSKVEKVELKGKGKVKDKAEVKGKFADDKVK